MALHRFNDMLRRGQVDSAQECFAAAEGYTYGFGKTVGNGVQGWAPGAAFVHTDGAAGTWLCVNVGSKTTASWAQVPIVDDTLTHTIGAVATENNVLDFAFTNASTFLAGSNLTYSGGYGSAAIKVVSTYSGVGGGFSNIYSNVTHSGAQTIAGTGVIGIKSVVTNTAAMSNGVIYGGMFIAKHSHETNVMTASATLCGVEGWAYLANDGPARTAIGGNFALHNECTAAIGDGSVHRVVQLVCDNASGAEVATESTGLCIWNMAGAWDNAIRITSSSTGFTNFLYVDGVTGFASADTGTVPATSTHKLKVNIGGATGYIPVHVDW